MGLSARVALVFIGALLLCGAVANAAEQVVRNQGATNATTAGLVAGIGLALILVAFLRPDRTP